MQNFQQTATVKGWVRLNRSDDVLQLIRTNPLAYTLATVIALRAKWSDGFNEYGLEQGEALLGDFEEYGMTEQNYRTAKAQLTKWNFATFKATNAGTIAKLTDKRLFEVTGTKANGRNNGRPTDAQRTPNGRVTTNQPSNTDQKEKMRTTNPQSSPSVLTQGIAVALPPEVGRVAFNAEKMQTPHTFENITRWIKHCFNRESDAVIKELAENYFNKFESVGWVDKDNQPIRDWKAHSKGYCEGHLKNLTKSPGRGVDRREMGEYIKGRNL